MVLTRKNTDNTRQGDKLIGVIPVTWSARTKEPEFMEKRASGQRKLQVRQNLI